MVAKVTVTESYLVQGDDTFEVFIEDGLLQFSMNSCEPVAFLADEAREVACCMLALADRLDEQQGE